MRRKESGSVQIMSHVSALPQAPSTSVIEDNVVEATQFALATLESFPSVLDAMDAGDAAVSALGVIVVARAVYAALAGGAASSTAKAVGAVVLRWSPFGWLSSLLRRAS